MEDYIISPKVIIRTHRNSFNELKSFYKKNIDALFCQTDIQDAIYIASSDLYEKLTKYPSLENKEKEQVRNSFIRYINRMSTRCTPFGLFAGCAIGTIGERTNLTVSQKIIRHTRLDMNYLCSLSQYLSNIPEIKYKLKYYPNNSLYIVGDEYRYIEYHYLKDSRVHQVSSVKRTFYLSKILRISKTGVTIEDLYPYIINEYIQEEDAINYIDDLIQSQILVSELDPAVTGDDLLNRILSILNSIGINSPYRDILKSIQHVMKQIDMDEGDSLNKYEEIENLVKNIEAPYNRKYLLQVDINNVFTNSTIGASIRKEIESTVTFLNKIIPVSKDDNLSKFQEEFTKRFEEKEIPLLIALDPEIGIGYPKENGNKDVSPLLDEFYLPKNIKPVQNVTYSIIQSVLLKKLSEQNDSLLEIEIKNEDFKDIIENRVDLPDTFSVLFEIIRDSGNNILIRLKSTGNSSAANLFARFAYTDKKIEDLVKEITKKEQSLNPDVILAEIAHLPDSRVGNVLYRPHLRNYEIVYLANSSMPKDKVIFASDIMLSVKYGKLFLRSKRLNKEIMPHLTNAHIYSLSTIPIYRFLCDMQYQNQRDSLKFDIGFLKNELPYVPRIRYKHTVLSPATWNIKIDEIKHLISIKEDENLLHNTNIWREKKKISNYSLLSDWDNDLFIDWGNAISLRAFLSVVKNRDSFRLIEFLYNEKDAVIRDKSGNGYLNECIAILLKNEEI
jgi:hypothetical protein